MEYYCQYITGKTNHIIAVAQEELNAIWQASNTSTDSFLLNLAVNLSEQNINIDGTGKFELSNIQGGPFAAVIVKYEKGLDKNHIGIGKPAIVGAGTNHVIFENDPCAHGEISAIRDACARLGYSDLSGMVMFTSCECCPQCQACITSSGIARVVFANNRLQAQEIGFSDKEQYLHINNFFKYMTDIDKLNDKPLLLEALGDHGAVVLNSDYKVVAYGDTDLNSSDPLASLASMNAILSACKKNNNFHLAEDYILLTCNKIHPIAFTTADWARIGRVRSKENPDDPSCDDFEKDPSKIIFVNKQFEQMQVKAADGDVKIVCKAEDTLEEVKSAPKDRHITKTQQTDDQQVLKKSAEVFDRWQKMLDCSLVQKY